ncbi:MAG: hypothetical protein AB7F89_14320 [Pirellulaceae bacterium]
MQLGAINFMLRALRYRNFEISGIFSVSGQTLIRGLLLSVIVGALMGVAALVLCGVPALLGYLVSQEPGIAALFAGLGALVLVPLAIWFGMSIAIGYQLIADRQLGAMEALSQSRHYMQGNKLTAFLLFLITGILGGVFMCCTLYLGIILYLPFWNLLLGVVYLTVTGQPFQRGGPVVANPPTQTPFG